MRTLETYREFERKWEIAIDRYSYEKRVSWYTAVSDLLTLFEDKFNNSKKDFKKYLKEENLL